jgi:hypothetical protein
MHVDHGGLLKSWTDGTVGYGPIYSNAGGKASIAPDGQGFVMPAQAGIQ